MLGKKTVQKPDPTVTPPSAPVAPQSEIDSNIRGIEFLGVGVAEGGDRYLKVKTRMGCALLNVDNINDSRSGELKRLTRLGEPLLLAKAKTEFNEKAQSEARKDPTFAVVTKTGWHEGTFVLPEGLDPKGRPGIERAFDVRYDQYHRKLHPVGAPKGWLRLVGSLCSGKTRLIAGICLAFTGPVCAAFGFEPPGLQLVSKGGLGKTTIGRVAAAVWGGDPSKAKKLGCGVSWNNTNLNLEIVAAAFNQMLLFLDDMHKATKPDVEAIIEIMNGEGRGRWTEAQRLEFCTPLFSTSNTSVIATAKDLGIKNQYEALIDRLIDIPLPNGCPYVFEGVRTADELRAFGDSLRDLSRENFGLAGRAFVHLLERDLKSDRALLQGLVDGWQQTYWDAAGDIKAVTQRDLTRVGDKFATIYVAACLAIRFGCLPFTEVEVLEALLTCQRDHVAFIDNELGATGTPVAAATPDAVAQTAYRALIKYVDDHWPNGKRRLGQKRFDLIDLRKPGTKLPQYHIPANAVGYIGRVGNVLEVWLPNDRFEKVAAGAREARLLKQKLDRLNSVAKWARGNQKPGYVVKRHIPGIGDEYVVAIKLPKGYAARRAA
jgi:hypothetical protein